MTSQQISKINKIYCVQLLKTNKLKEIKEQTKHQKHAIDMPRMTTRLFYTDYFIPDHIENSTSKLHYIKLPIQKLEIAYNSFRQYEVKLSRLCIGHTRLTHRYLMPRNY